ncbi:MAG: EAL domain-containing response regulator [Gammaproteobacteria bacterium]|nr:EAL domain-containing response regulator [Gammaproteobacteria bacterium]MDH5776998.1 EAL domain-containing response regulator [Gammaproteobacteria bacterium]
MSSTGPRISSALVIDDSGYLLDYFTVLLNAVGTYQVKTANNGRQALSILQDHPDIELLLCDINLPEMDGIEFLRHISAQSFAGEIIIVSSEHDRVIGSVIKLAREHELHILGVMKKPATLENLKSILSTSGHRVKSTVRVDNHVFTAEELHQAIGDKQFIAYFQPKVDIRSGKIIGAEALCRWRHPDMGIISPGAFIPCMENNGLIDELTDVMLGESIAFLESMQHSHSYFSVSINMPADYLTRLNFPDELHARVKDAGIRSSSVIIEITESRLIVDYKQALEIMVRLRLKGFGLSIDDFGTGYSSLEQLQNFPFQELKIDQAFVTGAINNLASQAIIESSVNLANKLDMKIVAEGVESRQDWDFVQEQGCDIVQGYFVAKPMSQIEFIAWLEQNKGYFDLGLPEQKKSSQEK